MRDNPPGASPVKRRILVREVNWLGDAVMSTPALQRLRAAQPEAHIALLCPEKLADLWLQFPWIDEVLTFAAGETPWSIGRRLRSAAFDIAMVFPNSPRSALEPWLARIPQRIGYSQPWRNWCLNPAVPARGDKKLMSKKSTGEIRQLTRGGPSGEESTQRYWPPVVAATHQMHEYLHLVAQLGADPAPTAPSLAVHADEIHGATSKFGLQEVLREGKPILALNPGAEYGPAKRWPVENFIAAALQIQRHTGCTWLILGGQPDAPLANQIAAALNQSRRAGTAVPATSLAGKTSLRDLMALLKLTRLLLTNDTGPMHVAAALDVSVVVPFGSTSPELTGPGLPADSKHFLLQAVVPCGPCFRRTCPIDFRCMRGITVEDVVQAVLHSLALLGSNAAQRQK